MREPYVTELWFVAHPDPTQHGRYLETSAYGNLWTRSLCFATRFPSLEHAQRAADANTKSINGVYPGGGTPVQFARVDA